jgi:hypothetical protein
MTVNNKPPLILMAPSELERELILFLSALEAKGKAMVVPSDNSVFDELAQRLLEVLPDQLPSHLGQFPERFRFLSTLDKAHLIYRLHQLLDLCEEETRKEDDSSFLVPFEWNRRWSDLIAGRLLSAQIAVCHVGE